jgi:hypothetical protein
MNRPAARAVLSYGMGADSTALLLRWIHEPATRPCALDQLLVITAMTGDVLSPDRVCCSCFHCVAAH